MNGIYGNTLGVCTILPVVRQALAVVYLFLYQWFTGFR
jgi:hypothetical protein